MHGQIKNFLQSKGYGFISGADGNDYFFHIKEIINPEKEIVPGVTVQFEESLTPKGYKAKRIKLLESASLYEIPDTVLTSKTEEIRGWMVMKRGTISIESSERSPDVARDSIKCIAQSLGVTGIINLRYYKTTGSDGNYNFSIHNFTGIPVALARKSINGLYTRENIPCFQKKLEEYQENREREKAARQFAKCIFFMFLFFILLLFIAGGSCSSKKKTTADADRVFAAQAPGFSHGEKRRIALFYNLL